MNVNVLIVRYPILFGTMLRKHHFDLSVKFYPFCNYFAKYIHIHTSITLCMWIGSYICVT